MELLRKMEEEEQREKMDWAKVCLGWASGEKGIGRNGPSREESDKGIDNRARQLSTP
jgi:hypothetical protein